MENTITFKNQYTFHNDPGHAWLCVPIQELAQLGVVNQISGYSYLNGNNAYLEEDCDAGVFLKARFPDLEPREVGHNHIKDVHTNNQSPIRSYAPYRLVDVARQL